MVQLLVRVLFAFSLLHLNQVQAAEKITVHYNERPPYMMLNTRGQPEGLTGTPVFDAFTNAGVAVEWVKTPSARQLLLIEDNLGQDCGIGWFKNAKREAFAKFTKAIYRDQPMVVLANSHFPISSGGKFEMLLSAKPAPRILIKESFSYGPWIDAQLLKYPQLLIKTWTESPQMVKMIKADRADIMIATPEEAQYFIGQAGLSASDMKIVTFSDMAPGEKRYLLCSKKVSDEVINKLNQAIRFE